MKTIKLDASNWHSAVDFYEAILPAIGAPGWHGTNANALTESMVWGEINALEPPYTVEIHLSKDLPPSVIQEIDRTRKGLATQRSTFNERHGHDVDVDVKIVD